MQRATSLPADLHSRWGHLRYVRQVAPNEWHSECPYCGDEGHDPSTGFPDRFHMHGENGKAGARGKCRKCGYFSWANEDKEYFPRPRQEKSYKEVVKKPPPVDLESVPIWFDYWRNMGDNGFSLWRETGITETDRDRLYLGYTPSYNEGHGLTVPALTIPYFEVGFKPVTIQYRLIGGRCRYKFMRGMPQTLYLANPDIEVGGRCLLLEGAKKAIVINNLLGLEFDCVVAFPNKTPPRELVTQLNSTDEVYIGLDPDANTGGESDKIAKLLADGGTKSRIVWWLDKPDDMVVIHGATKSDLMPYIRQARPVH